MSRFWQFISAALLLICAGISLLPRKTTYDDQPPVAAEMARYVLLGSLVAVAWAICFRQQVERLRISIFSLLILVAMEALLLGVDRLFNSN